MVGYLTPSRAITEEYAKADPIYVQKTIVSITITPASFLLVILCRSLPFQTGIMDPGR